MTTEEGERTKALSNAGFFLMRVQRYPEAADMLTAAAQGQTSGSQLASLISTLKKTKPRSQVNIDAADPSGVVQQFFLAIFDSDPDLERIQRQFISKSVPGPRDPKKEAKEFRQSMLAARQELAANGLPLQVVADIFLSVAKYAKEGDDAL